MAVEFLDANVILRFILQDHPDFSSRVNQLFDELSAEKIRLFTSEAVVTEVVHVLSSDALYGLPRAAIRGHLHDIFEMRSLEITHRASILRALDLYATVNIDFVDSLTVAHMEREGIRSVISFDRDFDKIEDITRREP
jgi:predicted nucleic-acid-binding protein